MARPKRAKRVGAYIHDWMHEQLELFKAEEANGTVLSMSDYLFSVIEEHIAYRAAKRRDPVRVSHQTIGRRVGQQ